MKDTLLKAIGLAGISTLLVQCKPGAAGSDDKPNIILILADDLGYGDIGIYGQSKFETPNIDLLARTGIYFTDFYCGSPVSAPSRCMLLTGLHSGHAQIRGNDEWQERGEVWNYRKMIGDSTLEGQKPLETGTVTLPAILKKVGYITGMSGKWGLGAPHTESVPTKMGFDWFFGINCQRMAHTYYPVFLYENEHRYYLNNDTVPPHTPLPEGADPLDPGSYRMFNGTEYAPDVMFDKMSSFIKQNSDHPFFLYWATPLPHTALQAPQKWIDYYHGRFGDETPYTGDHGYFPALYPRAAYAAMISCLDEQVGLLINQLKVLGIYDNTIILFTSDNGPTYTGGTDSQWFDSGGPFRSDQGYGKGNVNEGGIRVPLIVSWPGKIRSNRMSGHVSAFWDILPTLCEVAGAEQTANADGISFLPELLGKRQKKHEFLYWEFPESGGQQAVRLGDYKAMRKNINNQLNDFELYDLRNDPSETLNIASENPEVISRIIDISRAEHTRSDNTRWQIKALDK